MDRKYCIISKKGKLFLEDVRNNNTEGLCFRKFKFDYVYDGDTRLHVGDKVTIENIEMEITKAGKECFPDCVYKEKHNIPCMLTREVYFAR